MKQPFLIMAFVFSGSLLQAQGINTPVYNNEGFFANVSILGAAWNLNNANIGTHAGAGLGLQLGYNINPNIGMFASIDASSIEPDDRGSYMLGHFDLGVQGIFRTSNDRVRPFARASFARASVVGMPAQIDDIEVNGAGTGFGLGAGLMISLTKSLAFDVNYTHSWISVSEIKTGSQSPDLNFGDLSADIGRFILSLTYHF